MIVNTVTEAKAQLSALLEKVLEGEEIVPCRNGKPLDRGKLTKRLGELPGPRLVRVGLGVRAALDLL